MTLLPVASAQSLSVGAISDFFATCFFPGCRLELSEVVDRAQRAARSGWLKLGASAQRAIDRTARRLVRHRSDSHSLATLAPGLAGDAFALARRCRTAAAFAARGSLLRWLYLRTRRPHRARVFGSEQRAQATGGALAQRHDGVVLSERGARFVDCVIGIRATTSQARRNLFESRASRRSTIKYRRTHLAQTNCS